MESDNVYDMEKKNCFIGHRRFLPLDHGFRQNQADFDGKLETRSPPATLTGSTIIHQLEQFNVTLGKKDKSVVVRRKRDRSDAGRSSTKQWKKKSIFLSCLTGNLQCCDITWMSCI